MSDRPRVERVARRRVLGPAAALVLAAALIGCGSEDSTAGSPAPTSTATTVASSDGTTDVARTEVGATEVDDTRVDDTEVDETSVDDGTGTGNDGTEGLVALLASALPVLTADEATCVAGVVFESLGDDSAVIAGAPSGPPLRMQVAQLTMAVVERGGGSSVEQNAARVSACVPNPVSFSGSATPPTGDLATCANATLAGTPEYQTYTGEFRFLGHYYDRAAGAIVAGAAGVEVNEATAALLVGACAG